MNLKKLLSLVPVILAGIKVLLGAKSGPVVTPVELPKKPTLH
jgi:hypothetical protein